MVILDENMLSLPDQAVVVPLDLVCVPIGEKQLSRWLEIYSRCRIARSEIQRSAASRLRDQIWGMRSAERSVGIWAAGLRRSEAARRPYRGIPLFPQS